MTFRPLFVFVSCVLIAVRSNAQTCSDLETANQHRDAALLNQLSRTPGWGDDLRAAANEYACIGEFASAIGVAGELLNDPENSFDTVTSLDMKCRYLFLAGRTQEALAANIHAINTFNASDTLRENYPEFYAELYAHCATLQYYSGNVSDAILMSDKLLNAVPDNLSADLRETVMRNKISYCLQSGLDASALIAIDQMFLFKASAGREDGTYIDHLLKKLEIEDSSAIGEDYVNGLNALWSTSDTMRFPQSAYVGMSLSSAYARQNQDSLSMDIAAQMLARLDAYKASWLVQNNPMYDEAWCKIIQDQLLNHLLVADGYGRPWLSLWASKRLLASEQISEEQRVVIQEIHQASSAAVLSNDESQPPNSLAVFPGEDCVIRVELATVLQTSFNVANEVPVRIVSAAPLVLATSYAVWNTSFTIYALDDTASQRSQVFSGFDVVAPSHELIQEPRTIGIVSNHSQNIHPGVYAVVPKAAVRFDVGGEMAANRMPNVTWPGARNELFSAPYGVYYFRVAADCNGNSLNDAFEILTNRAALPSVELDANSNGVLDACEGNNVCRADYNKNHQVTVQDIFDFLDGWFSGEQDADIDGSGVISVQDIFVFLALWFGYDPAVAC